MTDTAPTPRDSATMSHDPGMPGRGRLLQQFLPHWHFQEQHRLVLPPGDQPLLPLLPLAAAALQRQWLVRQMFRVREAPIRLAARLQPGSPWRSRPPFGLQDFTELGRHGDTELALGLAGRFWRLDYGLQPLDGPAAFLACNHPGLARLVLWFGVEALPDGRRVVHTCTRVLCHDWRARLLFAPYWYAIRLGSGLIRRRLLRCLLHIQADRSC